MPASTFVCVLLVGCDGPVHDDRKQVGSESAELAPRVSDEPAERPVPRVPEVVVAPEANQPDTLVAPPRDYLTGLADVEIRSKDAASFPQIKVGKQIERVEPAARLRLSAGEHAFAIRQQGDKSWQSLKPLRIKPGLRYKVTLDPEGGWTSEELGPAADAKLVPRRQLPADLEPLPLSPSSEQPVDSAVVGDWRETARISCDGGGTFVPHDPIGELVFWAAGSFRVTWSAFETYHDYHGKYQLDTRKRQINLSDFEGNYVPTDIYPRGRIVTRGDTLILEGIWLGSSRDGSSYACGHHFEPL